MNKEKRISVAGIEAILIRKSVKNVRVTIVPPGGEVRVSAPRLYPETLIRVFLAEKADWIRTHVEKVKKSHANEPKNYESGETIRLFGTVYPLLVSENRKKNAVVLESDHVALYLKSGVSKEKREALVTDWLRERLKTEIAHFIPLWSERTGLVPSEWTVRNMTSRWGSCNTRTGKITLNLQLVRYPLICLEYVILHELAHLRVHGHGADFKALLDAYMPDWRERKRRLS